jgi:DNA gyrase subunit A
MPLNSILSFEQGERVTSAVAVPDFTAAEFLTMATARGKIKRTPLSEFDGVRSSGIAAINLGRRRTWLQHGSRMATELIS